MRPPPAAVAEPRSLKVIAVAATAVLGLIHLWMAGDAFGNATYEGVLFVANGIGALVAAALVAGSTLLGYVMSRTVGLPGLPAEPENWFEPLGVVSVAAELVFLTVFAMMRRQPPVALS
jgi:hypothetical protein